MIKQKEKKEKHKWRNIKMELIWIQEEEEKRQVEERQCIEPLSIIINIHSHYIRKIDNKLTFWNFYRNW